MNQSYLIEHPSIFKRIYVVSDQSRIIATIKFHGLSNNTQALAKFNARQWKLKNNFLGNKISLAPVGTPNSPLLTIDSSIAISKASVKLGDKEFRFEMVPLTKDRQSFVWLDDAGNKVMRFNKKSILRLKFQIVIPQPSIASEDINILIVLGFYLIKSKYPGIGTPGSY